VENLLSRGISFLTCFRSSETVPRRANTRIRGYSGLGYRPPQYQPDMRDYRSYVSIRRRFFRSPRGRAALLYGGIIGRLARSEVSNEEVLRGPSDDALLEGICLWDGKSPFAYWDDCLTEEEIDLICGVYHVSTGVFFFFVFWRSLALTIAIQASATVTSSIANRRQLSPGGPGHRLSRRLELTLAGGHPCGKAGTRNACTRWKADLRFS
jgi:hypothetical protein